MHRSWPAASLLVLTGVSTALAHPGHGPAGDQGIWHYVSTPQHLIVGGLLFVLALAGGRAAAQLIFKYWESRLGPRRIRK